MVAGRTATVRESLPSSSCPPCFVFLRGEKLIFRPKRNRSEVEPIWRWRCCSHEAGRGIMCTIFVCAPQDCVWGESTVQRSNSPHITVPLWGRTTGADGPRRLRMPRSRRSSQLFRVFRQNSRARTIKHAERRAGLAAAGENLDSMTKRRGGQGDTRVGSCLLSSLCAALKCPGICKGTQSEGT